MVIYNALPRKEYERIFMCNTAKDIWKTLLITHQGKNQVKDNKIDLLVQQYEQFIIFEDESIDSVFARFNTIITSLKALDEGYSSKKYVRKFLRALNPKWRANVTAIKESKDLTSLSLDELIGILKVHEMIIKKDSKIVKAKVERKSLALKAKKESSDDSGSQNSKSDRKCFRCGDPNHLIGECPKPPKYKNQRAFFGGSWSGNDEEDDEKIKDEICLGVVAHAPNEVCSDSSYFSDENSSIDDLALDNEYDKLCKMSLKIITKNKRLKATRNSLENELRELKAKLSTLEKNKRVDLDCVKCHTLKIENEKLKEESIRLNRFEKSTHCLNEMLSNRKLFSTYKAYNGGNVIFGSNLRGNIIGKGQICDNKCRVTFFKHDSEITRDGKVISRGIRKKGLYVIKLRNKPKDQICLATIDENFTLWHRRLGHANMLLIQSLASKELVRNLPKLKFDQHFCDACKIGKQAHASHKAKNIVSTTRCLELLHIDLFGPFTVQSYGGNRYTLVILDDYSRLESIRILLAYACALDFKLFQMDVKSAFLNGFINEEVYVAQPPGFIDFEKPDHVYKLKKALYGLKQAPKAWYDRLKDFLIKHEYKIGMVDNTLFTKKKSSNLIIVQIYVDDIIFGLTCQDMCDEFAKIMHDEFEMSMMGELNFFLGLQIKQMEDGIFFNQSKYIKEMLKKFGLEDSKPMKTPMSSDTKLTKDEECESVDSTKYRGMIVSAFVPASKRIPKPLTLKRLSVSSDTLKALRT
ncbi:retrovirus-related pol polyprotein from transposon TNT 1-94 [Tanacetum coccineum]|uniref:Retrovirus-related pol polyprotein from transposon TNT 1-94 n=1 Tax=Tanacetum coccineum TaxID=301880 RepID=A0ABQ4ZN39_9ASTR